MADKPAVPGPGGRKKKRYTTSGAARGGKKHPAPPEGKAKPTERRRPERPISPGRQRGFAGGERPYEYAFYESEPATEAYMARLFHRHDWPVTPEQLARFWRYYQLLREHNASLDLTRIMGIEATVLKHFVDSAIILRQIELSGPVLDIGSGPGFPGVPLAIMRPGIDFILAESRGKRVGFLETVVRELGLKNVSLFPRSVREDSPLGDECGKPVGDVITRALETVSPTLERVLPFIRPGAKVIFLKGPACDQEIQTAQAGYRTVYDLFLDSEYTLPNTDQQRRLVVFQRRLAATAATSCSPVSQP